MGERTGDQELTLAAMIPGLIGIAFLSGIATTLVTNLTWYGRFDWAALEPRLLGMVIGLMAVGALAAIPRGGWIGFAACAAGSAAGFALFAGVHAYFAGVLQGVTVVGVQSEFLAFAFAAFLSGFAVISAGYALVTVVLVQRGRPATRLPAWARHRPVAITGLVATVLAMTAASASLAVSLAGSEAFLAGDPGSGSEAIHRITISESEITVDTDIIEAGEVTWLATVEGNPPRDLTLIDEAGHSLHGIGTPPPGAHDFLLMRMEMTPGRWLLTAGLPPDDPHPTEWQPPIGALAAWFEVAP